MIVLEAHDEEHGTNYVEMVISGQLTPIKACKAAGILADYKTPTDKAIAMYKRLDDGERVLFLRTIMKEGCVADLISRVAAG